MESLGNPLLGRTQIVSIKNTKRTQSSYTMRLRRRREKRPAKQVENILNHKQATYRNDQEPAKPRIERNRRSKWGREEEGKTLAPWTKRIVRERGRGIWHILPKNPDFQENYKNTPSFFRNILFYSWHVHLLTSVHMLLNSFFS